MDKEESKLQDESDITGLVTEAFLKACRIDLGRNEFSCREIYPLNRIIFNDCLSSKVTDISRPAYVKTHSSEVGDTDIYTLSKRSWKQTAEELKKCHPFLMSVSTDGHQEKDAEVGAK
jgi:hypothetical protein